MSSSSVVASKLALSPFQPIAIPQIVGEYCAMFGSAYIILPFSDQPPGEAIAQSLARFERGRRGDLPEEWLRFHDDTADLRKLYGTTFSFTLDGFLRVEGGEHWYLSSLAVSATMRESGRDSWTVRFADIEPDLAAFVETYCAFEFDRHPVTGGFGRWLNPLGQWDWWDLGGCSNGTITGRRRKVSDRNSAVSSGDCIGRRAFETLSDLLCDPDDEPFAPIDIATNENIELVSTLGTALRNGRKFPVPSALVLPPNSVPDEGRWLDMWPELMGLVDGVEGRSEQQGKWRGSVKSIYNQFGDHWAAAVAYHF